ncbi:MAG: hypothetical protein ACOYVG_09915 [Bacteroidota bacterium]
MARRIKVHFTGIENNGWALDEIQRIAIDLTKDFVESVPIETAEIVHSAWWHGLRNYSVDQLNGKRLISDFDNPVSHWLTQPGFQPSFEMNMNWVGYSSQSLNELKEYIGKEGFFVPFRFDETLFYSVDKENENRIRIAEKLKLPDGKYIIGNFQRDTDGADLSKIKIQKAPDLFLEIVLELHQKGLPIHILLAGPRRHWIIGKFEEYGISYTYFGKKMDTDDFSVNRLDRSTLNILYSFLDLCLLTSRWEGGPYAIAEAVMSRTKVISSRVGIAEDVLAHNCLYNSVTEAISIIEQDILTKTLDRHISENKTRLLENFGKESVRKALIDLYQSVLERPPFEKNNLSPEYYKLFGRSRLKSLLTLIRNKIFPSNTIRISSQVDSGFFKEVIQTLEQSSIRISKNYGNPNASILFCYDDFTENDNPQNFNKVSGRKFIVINDESKVRIEDVKYYFSDNSKDITFIFKNRGSLKPVSHLFVGNHVFLWEGLHTSISGKDKMSEIFLLGK